MIKQATTIELRVIGDPISTTTATLAHGDERQAG